MSFTVLPPQQDNRGSFGRGLMEGLSGGISRLHEQLAKHRENTHLKNIMGGWNKDTSTQEKLMSLVDSNISSESKAFLGNVLLHMEDVKQKQEIATATSKYKMQIEQMKAQAKIDAAKETNRSKQITPEQASVLSQMSGIPEEQLVGQPLSVFNAASNAQRNNPANIASRIENEQSIKANIKRESEFYKNLNDKYSGNVQIKKDLESALKVVNKTGVTPTNLLYEATKDSSNPILKTIAKAVKSKDIQTIELAAKDMMGDNLRQLVTGRPTQNEFFWVEKAILPSMLSDPKTNQMVLSKGLGMVDMQLKLKKEADRIIKESGGNIPQNLSQRAYEAIEGDLKNSLDEIMMSSDARIQLIDKASGEIRKVSAKKAVALVNAGVAEYADREY